MPTNWENGVEVPARIVVVPYNGKIADITHADTNKHELTLANAGGTGAIAGETRKIVEIITRIQRIVGTGELRIYPAEGATPMQSNWIDYIQVVIILAGSQRLQYALDTANDDFDLHCLGYVVEV